MSLDVANIRKDYQAYCTANNLQCPTNNLNNIIVEVNTDKDSYLSDDEIKAFRPLASETEKIYFKNFLTTQITNTSAATDKRKIQGNIGVAFGGNANSSTFELEAPTTAKSFYNLGAQLGATINISNSLSLDILGSIVWENMVATSEQNQNGEDLSSLSIGGKALLSYRPIPNLVLVAGLGGGATTLDGAVDLGLPQKYLFSYFENSDEVVGYIQPEIGVGAEFGIIYATLTYAPQLPLTDIKLEPADSRDPQPILPTKTKHTIEFSAGVRF